MMTPETSFINYQKWRSNVLSPEYLLAINEIEQLIERSSFVQATADLNRLVKSGLADPSCVHLVYLSARVFDRMADVEKNNQKLKRSIQLYEKVLELSEKLESVDKSLIYSAGNRLIERLEFIGRINEAIRHTETLLKRFKDNLTLLNRQGINFLIADRPKTAKEYFGKVLAFTNHTDPVALCHFAFVLKLSENKPNESVEYFSRCLLSQDKRVMDGRFFYHLGDALQRIGRTNEVSLF